MVMQFNKENNARMDKQRDKMGMKEVATMNHTSDVSYQGPPDSSGGIFGDMKLLYENRSYKYLYIRLSWQFLLFLTTLNVFAAIYQAFEQQQEISEYTPAKSRQDVIGNFTSQHNVTESVVRKLFKDIDRVESSSHERKSMSYMEAIILTLSVFYTIGWGHVLPHTTGAKIFCVISSCVGIPITFVMIITGAKIFIRHMQDIIRFIFRLPSCAPTNQTDYDKATAEATEANSTASKVTNNDRGRIMSQSAIRIKMNDGDVNPLAAKLLLPSLVAVLITFMLSTAAIIMKIEGFSYIDSLYYCFVSLSTIGFGDFIQTTMTAETDIAKAFGLTAFLFFWILFGIIVVAANLLILFSCKIGNFNDCKKHLKDRYNETFHTATHKESVVPLTNVP